MVEARAGEVQGAPGQDVGGGGPQQVTGHRPAKAKGSFRKKSAGSNISFFFQRGGGLNQTKSFEATYFRGKASLSKKRDLTIGLVKDKT